MDYQDIINVIWRTILVLWILFFITKIIGKRQISQMNLYDYIIGITIGSIAADISLDIEKNLISGIVSLVIYALFSLLLTYLTMKSITLRRFFVGVPTVLIEKGKIIEKGLTKCKININDLLEEARTEGYFNIEEIDYALMETSGKISFLPKEKEKPATKKDMAVTLKKQTLTANLIIDEEVLEENLNDIGKDKKWLMQQLKVQGYNNTNGILLATFDSNQKLKIYEKNEKVKKKSVLE